MTTFHGITKDDFSFLYPDPERMKDKREDVAVAVAARVVRLAGGALVDEVVSRDGLDLDPFDHLYFK